VKDADWKRIREIERRHDAEPIPENLMILAALLAAVAFAVLAALWAAWVLGGI